MDCLSKFVNRYTLPGLAVAGLGRRRPLFVFLRRRPRDQVFLFRASVLVVRCDFWGGDVRLYFGPSKGQHYGAFGVRANVQVVVRYGRHFIYFALERRFFRSFVVRLMIVFFLWFFCR